MIFFPVALMRNWKTSLLGLIWSCPRVSPAADDWLAGVILMKYFSF